MKNNCRYIILSNGNEWCYYSWRGYLSKHPEVDFLRDGNPIRRNRLFKWLWKKHFSPRRGKFLSFFRKLWHPFIVKGLRLSREEKTIFLTYDWNLLTTDLGFYKAIKKKYPNVTLVYMFTNIVRFTGSTSYGILNNLNSVFDYVFAFDKEDASKYGFLYSPLIYTSNDDVKPSSHMTDLFYVGKAKDRLSQLLAIYEKAIAEGLSCDFNIVDVPVNDQKYKDGIVYNKPLSYRDVLSRIKSTRCLVDAIQGDSVGLTIKTCEAVVCGKKLVTTNEHVKEECFYHPGNIMVLKDGTQIPSLKDFLDLDKVQYSDEAKFEFAPERLFKEINVI